ncbi:MAG: RND transporter [Ancylobacter novellus]|uniref:RND transporter n=1 Tax=Ancylobacter novellus TaxID=921 RepID=A0A2W5K5E9_ANCNO|nr:MAG: RND transporter [Ancylobacter novellus]
MKKTTTLGAALAAVLLSVAAASAADGTVKKIDEAAGKITLDHGPIRNLDMEEPMSMVFRAADPAMLNTVKVGDRVTFEAERVNGQITVTTIRRK